MWILNKFKGSSEAFRQYEALLGTDAPEIVRTFPTVQSHPFVTPLHSLGALAKTHNLKAIYAKDEGYRLGLGSFKALGGSYAVARLVQKWAEKELSRTVLPSELMTLAVTSIAATKTVVCATDGNHGRSVAAGAKLFGCQAVIFLHHNVSLERIRAIQDLDADIRIVNGTYDDSVDQCTEVAKANNWQVVADTSWPGYEEIPGLVMQGYTVMIDECLSELKKDGDWPSHIFVQGGCGGLAAAVFAHALFRSGKNIPKFVVVEPDRANCILQSASTGNCVRIAPGESTVMAMLECYQPSLLAWQILNELADIFMDISDDEGLAAMRQLAYPLASDPPVVAGESGAAGLAGLIAASKNAQLRSTLELTPEATVLVIISEGATSPVLYQELIDKKATSRS